MSKIAAAVEDPRRDWVRDTAARVLGLCVALAAVVAISGAARSWSNAVAWMAETLTGGFAGLAAGRWVVPANWYAGRMWAPAMLLIATLVSLPVIGVCLVFRVGVDGVPLGWPLLIDLVPSVFGVTLVMTGLAFLIRRPAAVTHAGAQGAPPAKFLERLPAKLRGAELFAVEAEDHYLRLHTSLGQGLLLMRLSDAIAELEGLEGAQTHRSWWVARAAVTQAEKLDGRAVLTLKDGAQVPVSRGFARGLRAAGWF